MQLWPYERARVKFLYTLDSRLLLKRCAFGIAQENGVLTPDQRIMAEKKVKKVVGKKAPKAPLNPLSAACNAVATVWKPQLIWELLNGTRRFSELKKALPDINQSMLSQQLKELEKDGLIKRKVFAEVPPRVEYSLTVKGMQLKPVLNLLNTWGKECILEESKPAVAPLGHPQSTLPLL